jgi:DNA polymerase-3 subunit alpha
LKTDQVLIAECKISRDDYSGGDALRIMANHVVTLQTARERYARSLSLALNPEHDVRQLARLLESYQQAGENRIPLKLSYQNHAAKGDLKVGSKWMIVPKASLFSSLEELLGESNVGVNW